MQGAQALKSTDDLKRSRSAVRTASERQQPAVGQPVADQDRLVEILESVVRTTRELAEEPNFERGINRWLSVLGEKTDAARASFYDTVGEYGSSDQDLRILAEWALPYLAGTKTASFDAPVSVPYDPDDLWWREMNSNRVFAVQVDEVDAVTRQFLEEKGNATVLLVPFRVKNRTWMVSFDFLTRCDFNDRYRSILQTAANSIASEIERRDAEAAKLNAERERAEEQARLADILQSVVRATRELVEEPNFERGINNWLAVLGEKTDATRASFYDTIGEQGSAAQQLRATAEWVRPGVTGSMAYTFNEPVIMPIDTDHVIFQHIIANHPYAAQIDDQNGAARDFMESQGNATTLLVPFRANSRSWSISFDFSTHREFDERALSILQTAANSIASEIERRDAETAKLNAERERAETAEAAAKALERRRDLLEAVVETSDRLLGASSFDDVADWTCERIGKALAGDRVTIGHVLPADDESLIGYMFWSHEWDAPNISKQIDTPELQKLDLASYVEFYECLHQGEALHILTDDIADARARTEQTAAGSQSQFVYPIMVDGELWGCIGCDDCYARRIWNEAEIATLGLVASAIGSLVQRERLTQARLSAERAVAAERARMAREIHDTLAQGFTGVIMQAGAAEEVLAKGDSEASLRHIGRAKAIAGASLQDARRSVFALLPSILEGRSLASALEEQLSGATQDSGLEVRFSEVGQPVVPSNLVATEFIRIAQEATTNAIRHARATTLDLELAWDSDKVRLKVSDDGQGFVPSIDQAGFGLISMRERAQRMGAHMWIDSAPGQGTQVTVTARPGSDSDLVT